MAYPQESFHRTSLAPGSLLYRRRRAVSQQTILYQLDVLRKTGRYNAFELNWHPSYNDPPDVWPIPNHLFWDSDVAKWIEGACYFLKTEPNAEVEAAIEELVRMIQHAQQPDGYINIHYTVVEPGKRFTNLRDMHELYNAGHLIESALAHNDLYHNFDLLGPIMKYVDLLCKTFGPLENQVHGYPGHPEIELALLRLFHRTGQANILELANFFIQERGSGGDSDREHYYVAEAKARGEGPGQRPAFWPTMNSLWYYQAHTTIIDQDTIEGHSVRAMYLLAAAADLVRLQGATRKDLLLPAVERLWRNMVDRKMYVTGGIGAMKQWEGFGIDYFLPQSTDEGGCYSETCAAIGVMMLAERLLKIRLDGQYGDIMELCLYNAVLTAMDFQGRAFTYVNQLASSDEDLSQRQSWFTCACCPPNIMRLLGQIGGYATTYNLAEETNEVQINVHLFMASTLSIPVGEQMIELQQSTNWPWSGDVKFEVRGPAKSVNLNIRIPAWAEYYSMDPPCPGPRVENGYLSIPSLWLAENPQFLLSITIRPRVIKPHPFTNQNTIALARGPVVYCVEDVDNSWVDDHFKSLYLDPKRRIEESLVRDSTTGDEYMRLTMRDAAKVMSATKLSHGPGQPLNATLEPCCTEKLIGELHFVPYYFRANRGGKGHMRVGLRRWEKS